MAETVYETDRTWVDQSGADSFTWASRQPKQICSGSDAAIAALALCRDTPARPSRR